ncbi:TetR/AcrR family transcriptional regulator [Xenorhabdus bovienii]|uniref:Putative regulator with homeodomain-like DNA binding domain (TetR/AcrR family) n=1 Tax=Xenorhabdus bovienii str. kraussei Becker Underwood TaxID=1398204 RepID=A0A077PN17_XENBV|nr:TetR/AcrR family transcriptional regulator [Xenorhabdus bovienii]CDH22503.1 putative regulator with homeodomain-like DNA binding domain (TetR/AcrR family) [Xenorhabdus bovienii str. kraussei Becker Underwood]
MTRKRGRPLNFDKELALKKAMDIFWAKGFEGTQLVDLTAVMGINPPSFYAAFGSKFNLFCEAVQLYIETIGNKTVNALNDAKTTKEGLKAMLENSIINASSNEAGGCLMIMGIVNNRAENYPAWEYLREERAKTLTLIQLRIERGIMEGDLPKNTDSKTLAEYFLGITQAISFQARDGVSKNTLQRLIEPALAALPSSNTLE